MTDVLDDLVDRLARTAASLRAGELEPSEAARLVDECARLAGDAATELDRRVRATADAPAIRPPAAGEQPLPGIEADPLA